MPASNPLRKLVDRCNAMPDWLGRRIITRVFCHKVKLAGTAKMDILETDGKQVTFQMKNRTRVQNHIGSVHAAGMALLAESATGFIVGINLPGDKLPLMKTMSFNYVKRATGDMQAVAWLSDEQLAKLQSDPKGEVTVAVKVTDAAGIEPVECEMIWAWVPRKS